MTDKITSDAQALAVLREAATWLPERVEVPTNDAIAYLAARLAARLAAPGAADGAKGDGIAVSQDVGNGSVGTV